MTVELEDGPDADGADFVVEATTAKQDGITATRNEKVAQSLRKSSTSGAAAAGTLGGAFPPINDLNLAVLAAAGTFCWFSGRHFYWREQ